MVYILFAHSGSGKTSLLRQLQKEYPITFNIKGATRASRGEDDDLVSYPMAEFPMKLYAPYVYVQGYKSALGEETIYGINAAQLADAVANGKPHWIFCSKLNIVRRVMRDYPDRAVLIYMYMDAPVDILKSILKSRDHLQQEDLNSRLMSVDERKQDYERNRNLFSHVLVNHYQSNKQEIGNEIHRLCAECINIMKAHGD